MPTFCAAFLLKYMTAFLLCSQQLKLRCFCLLPLESRPHVLRGHDVKQEPLMLMVVLQELRLCSKFNCVVVGVGGEFHRVHVVSRTCFNDQEPRLMAEGPGGTFWELEQESQQSAHRPSDSRPDCFTVS